MCDLFIIQAVEASRVHEDFSVGWAAGPRQVNVAGQVAVTGAWATCLKRVSGELHRQSSISVRTGGQSFRMHSGEGTSECIQTASDSSTKGLIHSALSISE